jgi:hypothetical protein
MGAVAFPLAWRGYRSGRADREGAVRLAAFVILVEITVELLRIGNAGTFAAGVLDVSVGVLRALGVAMLLGAFYVAVDLHARRQRPDVLISWNRALRLRLRDPDVRLHVAIGVGVGTLWAFLSALERALIEALGWRQNPYLLGDRVAEKIYSVRDALAGMISAVPQAIGYAFLALMILVALRIATRRPRAGVIVTGIVLAPIFLTRGAHPLTAILFTGVGGLLVFLWLLTRVGLLAVVVALFVSSILNTTPITLVMSSWYAELTAFGVALVVLLGAYGLIRGVSPAVGR